MSKKELPIKKPDAIMLEKRAVFAPGFLYRVYTVWLRHITVYNRHFISNAFPPLIEPLIFLVAIGLGISPMIKETLNLNFLKFVATGIVAAPAMWTSAFECSYATFIRLEFEKVYDGILSAPIKVKDLFTGEIIWAGTKAFMFSAIVLGVVSLFGLIPSYFAFFVPVIGFLTGCMFGAISLFVTSFVRTINHFSFYFTGFISLMFVFSGIMFPLKNLSANIRFLADILPLTHSVKLMRAFSTGDLSYSLIYSLVYIILLAVIMTMLAIKFLRKRLID